MRFMIIRKADANTEAGVMPGADLAQAMMNYHEQMGRELTILAGDGLKPSGAGRRVKFSAGKPLVIDGPFAETKELVAGYTVVDAPSLDAVVQWAKRWPAIGLEADVELEIRQLYEIDDFGDAFDEATRAQHERIFQQT